MNVVGRISGPLLKANLLRDGVDLAFETNLLYLDVNHKRIGINTSSPTHDLTVNGTIRTTNIDGLTQLTVGSDLLINGNTISTTQPVLTLSPTSGGVVYQSQLIAGSVGIQSNQITTTTTNTDLQLSTNGTGKVAVYSDMYVQGNIHATGTITADGNIIIGDQPTDIVTINAEISSDIIPTISNTYNLGSSSLRWNTIWTNTLDATTISATNITVNGINLIQTQGNIWYVASNGSDSYSGTLQNSPFKTIKHALSQAVAGDAIYVYPGTYQEILPLSVPAGVGIKGIDQSTTIITPTPATNQKDVFLIDGEVSIESITIKDFYYKAADQTGYAFKFKNGFKVTSRSPYIKDVSIITKGSVTSAIDPRGFDSGDAGKGAFFDASIADATSNYVSCLFESVNFTTPGVDSIVATNGVRLEISNCNTYYSNRGIYAYTSATGRTGNAYTVLKVSNVTGTYNVGDTVNYYVGPTLTATGIISLIGADGKIYIAGLHTGFVEAKIVNGVLQNQTVQLGTATAQHITLAFYRNFGAEIKVTGSSNFYGNYGVVGDGVGVFINLNSHGMFYIGSGKNDNNDPTNYIQINEISKLNNATIIYTDTNQNGDFRVGDIFFVDQKAGNVNFNNVNVDVIGSSGISLSDGLVTSNINPYQFTTGNLLIKDNSISSVSGNLTLTSANGNINFSNDTYITGNLDVTGNVTIGGNITIGDQTSDTISFVAGIDSDIIPRLDATFNIGSNSYNWNNIWAQNANIGNVNITSNNIQSITANSDLNISGNGTGSVNIGSFNINQNIISVSPSSDFIIQPGTNKQVTISSTASLKIPTGTTLQRPGTPQAGMIRFNTTNTNYEGYDGSNWRVLNGLYDVAQTTYIIPESSPGANDHTFYFYINNSQVADLNSSRLNIPGLQVQNITVSNNTITTTAPNTDITLSTSGTGSVVVENFQINNNVITNTVPNSITTFAQTGTGYFKIAGSSGFVVPTGSSINRPANTQVGLTRFNTDDLRLEVYDGNSWISCAGSAAGVSYADAQEISIETVLMLG